MSTVKERAEAFARKEVVGEYDEQIEFERTIARRSYLAGHYAETIRVLEGLMDRLCSRCNPGNHNPRCCEANVVSEEIARLKAERDAK